MRLRRVESRRDIELRQSFASSKQVRGGKVALLALVTPNHRLVLSWPSAGRRPTAHESSGRRRLELSSKALLQSKSLEARSRARKSAPTGASFDARRFASRLRMTLPRSSICRPPWHGGDLRPAWTQPRHFIQFGRPLYTEPVDWPCCSAKIFPPPPWQGESKTLWDLFGVGGAMRPQMIIHGYRPAKMKPVTAD